MNDGICIDANIFVSTQDILEPHYRTSVNVLQEIETQSKPIFIPAVFLFETTSVLHRKRLQGLLTTDQALRSFDLLRRLPFLAHWDLEILEEAQRMASMAGVKRINDYTYVAVAQKRKIPFVTLDEQLIKTGKQFYSQIVHASNFHF
ncbi:MAG: type II toxin-antitoxin system VapC family toxin [Deltaproteobacteria bacterium]|nr:MAG: type II toxin-antitoxin system VapC family toxin [Deltaproteobacteria bacterium]